MKKTLKLFLTYCLTLMLAASLSAEVLQEITVKEGDTLWGVANFYLKNPQRWPEILKHNKLPSSDPNIILPGMKLQVPMLLIKEHLRAAELVQLLNDVRYRKRMTSEWKEAAENMKLYNEDGLRTLKQSMAKVKFPSGELLKLEENSLVILRPDKAVEEVDLLSGGVRSSKTKILARETTVNPKIEPRGPSPDFKTRLKEDKTTMVEVYNGIVDVTAQGRTVTLTKGFGTEVKFKQPPSLPHALPPQPEIDLEDLTPVPGTKLTSASRISAKSLEINIKTPESSKKIAPIGGRKAKVVGKIIKQYHIQVSEKFSFESIVMDKVSDLEDSINLKFSEYNLPDGLYYYRIAYVDQMGFEGAFTTPTQFTVDSTPPTLEIFQSKGPDKGSRFVHIEGITEPDTLLHIGDKPIPVDDEGKFITALIERAGNKKFILVAEDRAGNKTTREVIIDKSRNIKVREIGEIIPLEKRKGFLVFGTSMAVLAIIVIIGVSIILTQ